MRQNVMDAEDYAVKLTEIIRNNNICSVTVVRMEVPCCGGIEYAVKKALQEFSHPFFLLGSLKNSFPKIL